MASALQQELALSGMNMGHLALLGFTPGILLCSGCKWEAGCKLRKEIGKVEIVPSVDQQVLDFSVSLLRGWLSYSPQTALTQ